MNKELFSTMQEQLKPGPQALEGLEAKLGAAPAAKPRWGRYVALAACAALVLTAIPVYSALNPPLHAYALGAADMERKAGNEDLGRGNGIDGTVPVGTGAAIVELPVQEEAAAAYQTLISRFTADYGAGNYPHWYGGAYIDEWGGLIVCVVGAPAEDKSLYLEIQELCGSQAVGFQDAKYPLAQLNGLQEQVVALLKEAELADSLWSSAVDEEANRLNVVLPFASKKALAGLHRLDPAGDAIAVTVVERQAVRFDTAPEEPLYVIDPAPEPAGEPRIEDLPQKMQPGVEQSAVTGLVPKR